MTDSELIIDNGLFVGRNDFKFRLPQDIETINNLLKTIKEYREYSHPEMESWASYIDDLIVLFGLKIESVNERTGILKDIRDENSRQIVFGKNLPEEQFGKVTNWLDWSTLFRLYGNSLGLRWALLTNGKLITVYDLSKPESTSNFCTINLEEIINQNQEESFYTLCKIIYYIKEFATQTEIPKPNILINRNINQFSQNNVNKVISQQINENTPQPRNIHNPFDVETPPSLKRLIQVYQEMTSNSASFEEACEKVAREHRVSYITVRQDCTQRIHLKEYSFCKLILSRTSLLTHLYFCFPKSKEYIDDIFYMKR